MAVVEAAQCGQAGIARMDGNGTSDARAPARSEHVSSSAFQMLGDGYHRHWIRRDPPLPEPKFDIATTGAPLHACIGKPATVLIMTSLIKSLLNETILTASENVPLIFNPYFFDFPSAARCAIEQAASRINVIFSTGVEIIKSYASRKLAVGCAWRYFLACNGCCSPLIYNARPHWYACLLPRLATGLVTGAEGEIKDEWKSGGVTDVNINVAGVHQRVPVPCCEVMPGSP